MTKLINPAVKTRVIELARQGKGRNEIAKILAGQISCGSVSSILRANRVTNEKGQLNTDANEPEKREGSSQVNKSDRTGQLSAEAVSQLKEKDSLDISTNDFDKDGYSDVDSNLSAVKEDAPPIPRKVSRLVPEVVEDEEVVNLSMDCLCHKPGGQNIESIRDARAKDDREVRNLHLHLKSIVKLCLG